MAEIARAGEERAEVTLFVAKQLTYTLAKTVPAAASPSSSSNHASPPLPPPFAARLPLLRPLRLGLISSSSSSLPGVKAYEPARRFGLGLFVLPGQQKKAISVAQQPKKRRVSPPATSATTATREVRLAPAMRDESASNGRRMAPVSRSAGVRAGGVEGRGGGGDGGGEGGGGGCGGGWCMRPI